MNRLWIRFALVIIGILLVVIIVPLFLGPFLFKPEMEQFSNQIFEEFFLSLTPDEQGEFEQQVISAVQGVVLRTLIVVGVAGMIAGVILSRMLSGPLQAMADGARAIAGRDLTHRVPVRGSAEMRIMAESFNEMAGQLEQAETLRRNLLADVAHELRNPVHILRGNLQAILDDVYPLNEEEVSRLMGQTEHLARLVDDLHELALAEAHQLPLHRQSVDLGVLTKEAAVVFQSLAEAREIELRVELLGVPPVASVDPDRLRQILQNLLGNALNQTPPGGHVLITVTEREGEIRITVTDSGNGIAPEHLPQVFDRFFRTDGARDRETGGAGLGLAIVKALIESHGGKVWAESAGIGRGSTFAISLPLVTRATG